MSPDRPWRVVAVDLDRTVLRTNGSVSLFTASTLRELGPGGYELVYVTARHLTALRLVSDHIGAPAEAICCAGAVTYRLPSYDVSRQRALSAEDAHAVVSRVRAAAPETAFGWVTESGAKVEHHYPDRLRTAETAGSGEGLPGEPVFKLFARNISDPPDSFDAAVTASVEGIAEVSHRFSGFADIVARGVDKASALREWCDARGVRYHEVVAFGDSAADIGMLRWAGLGVAVRNAEQKVLQVAGEVTGSCDEDGVAEWLRKNLRLRPDRRRGTNEDRSST